MGEIIKPILGLIIIALIAIAVTRYLPNWKHKLKVHLKEQLEQFKDLIVFGIAVVVAVLIWFLVQFVFGQ